MNLDIIKKHEGLRLKSYKCPADKWTIGYGNTFYEDGTPVRENEQITKERAEWMLRVVANQFWEQMKPLIKSNINENQKAALLSFAFNVGIGNFKKSTLLKKVNADPLDPSIRNEFEKWIKAGGKVLQGLVNRRREESALYEKPLNRDSSEFLR